MSASPTPTRSPLPGRRTSDLLLKRAVSLANVGVWQSELRSLTDPSQNVITGSEEFFRVFGYDPGTTEVPVDAFASRIAAEDRDSVDAAVGSAFDDGREHRMEHRVVRPDGSIRLVEAIVSIERGDGGRPVRAIGSVVDITNRRRLEAVLAEGGANAALSARIVEHSSDAIISATLDQVITTWNAAAEELFGWKASEVIGRRAQVLVPPGREDEVARGFAIIAGGGRTKPFETVRRRRDGTLVDVRVSCSPLVDGSGDIIGSSVAMRDITEERRAAAQLNNAQRIESIGRLAGGAAHDFNNLLMAISGHAELVRMDLPEDAHVQEDLHAILASVERGARMTRQLLAFSRRQVLRPSPVELNDVLQGMDSVLRLLADGGVRIEFRLCSESTLVLADRAQMEQATLNIVTNARDAMPGGGVLTIATSRERVSSPDPVLAPSAEPGEYVCLAVHDTGVGMDPEVQANIFEPFFTTKPRSTNAGMALPATLGVVQQSGGFMTVESERGWGSIFKVFLPCLGAPVTHRAPAAVASAAGGGNETILLVEDDPAVHAITSSMLSRMGYRVRGATDAHAALAILQDEAAQVDLLLTDIMLPDMTGLDLADIVQDGYPHIRILRMSGFAGHDAGSLDAEILQKPFSADGLAQAIRGALSA